MILCSFCEDHASYAFDATGLLWDGFTRRLAFCRDHLVRYYLAMVQEWSD